MYFFLFKLFCKKNYFIGMVQLKIAGKLHIIDGEILSGIFKFRYIYILFNT